MNDPETLRPYYEEALRFLERDAAETGFGAALLELQRDLYKEFEHILSSGDNDRRHHFLIVIPVADRPLMLEDCLSSLIVQCHTFQYGGFSADTNGPRYKKVSVFIFDDSKDDSNKYKIKEICAATTAAGVPTFYVGIEEQSEVLRNVPPEFRRKLLGLIGDFNGAVSPHKGASLTRNIAYLYIHSRRHEFGAKTLSWFIDSDEEFMIKIKRGVEITEIPFINYFYWLDRVFTLSDIEVLTGKVVGDPPVTPTVMINTFLDDIISFFEQIADIEPQAACIFHHAQAPGTFSAEYHDMVKLFGYHRSSSPKKYSCGLAGDHSVLTCFADFSNRALGFFYGLHPTRTQFYAHRNGFMATEHARTVYTGNYVITPAGIRHFIPFAALGLRMAGPTLGRILRGRVKEKFVSANLPLLHKRTITGNYMNEFRSGIVQQGNALDISGEFQRQFWGDIMLFTVEALTDRGYPERRLATPEIADTIRKVQDRIWKLYREHQSGASEKITRIRKYLSDPMCWWNRRGETRSSVENFVTFSALVEKNFGPDSEVIKKISDQIAEGSFTKKIMEAINSFYEEDRVWNELLEAVDKTL